MLLLLLLLLLCAPLLFNDALHAPSCHNLPKLNARCNHVPLKLITNNLRFLQPLIVYKSTNLRDIIIEEIFKLY